MAIGRRSRLPARSRKRLAGSQWLAVGEVAGHASGARILSAAAIDEQSVLDLFADRIETRHDGDFDPATGSVTPTRSRRLGAISIASGPDPKPDQAAIEQALIDGVVNHGLHCCHGMMLQASSGSGPTSRIASTKKFHAWMTIC